MTFVNVGAVSPALDYRCAPWTRAQGVDPIGSALTCDTFVLVDMPPPWPSDIGAIPAFADLLGRCPPRTRLLAVRPHADDADVPGVRVTIWRRTDSSRFAGTDHVVPAERLAGQVARLLEAPRSDPGHLPAPADVLLCGHGARDRCCARLGTRLALDVARTWPGVRVRRCSHTGGHRFAPTGFTLPDGRAWGFLDVDAIDAVVRRLGPPPLRQHYRGTTALDAWGQVAERELFERFGWAWLDHQLTSSRTDIAPGGRSATVELTWRGPTGPGTADATIEVVRDVPTLRCGEAPELAEKTAPELALRSISLRGTG